MYIYIYISYKIDQYIFALIFLYYLTIHKRKVRNCLKDLTVHQTCYCVLFCYCTRERYCQVKLHFFVK